MQPTEQNIIKAYNIARETGADSTCKVLEALYPDVDFTPKDNRPVEERIKTFDDALEALDAEHPLVKNYLQWCDFMEDNDHNLRAFLQLRIITAALNEGWEPQFDEDELRWYPWFVLYSADELAEKSDEWKAARVIVPLDNYRVVGRSNNFANANGGLVYAMRIAHRRIRSRTTGLGLPSRQKPSPTMPPVSSQTCGQTSISSANNHPNQQQQNGTRRNHNCPL